MVSNVRVREDVKPDKWHQDIERAREKASRLFKDVVAINLNNAIVVGRLDDISLDTIGNVTYPFCKLMLSRTKKFNLDGKSPNKTEDVQVCFVNNPDMIMEIAELQEKYPEVHEEVHILIKKDFFG